MHDAWRQFHGNGGNMGFKWLDTAMSMRTSWRLEVPSVAASPVVDDAGTIYLAGLKGELMAIDPAGQERWRRHYGHLINASPAIAEDGSIYFIQHRQPGAETAFKLASMVVKTNETGHHLWTFELPDQGYTTAAPKLWQRPEGPLVLVWFIRRTSGGPAGELVVLDPEGRVRAKSGPVGCPWPITGGNAVSDVLKKIGNGAKIFWEMISEFPFYEFDTSGLSAFPYFIEPTPAVTDADNLVEDGKALIAVADRLCNVVVFRFDGSRLEQLWRWQHDLELRQGTPLITPFGHLVIGDETGTVRAFHVETGHLDWTYEAGSQTLGSPASLNQPIHVATKREVHAIQAATGRLFQKERLRFDPASAYEPHASPVVSRKHVHVAAKRGLTSFELADFSRRGHDVDYCLGHLSPSPALGPAGELYAIHDDRELWAYPAP